MLGRFLQMGGPMMWPLLVCSVLLGAVLLERAWVLGTRGWRRRPLTPEALLLHRRVLPFFTDIPPSLGLLGTVVGVVHSFRLMDGRVDGEAVGAGLAIACMTTLFGLSIAIAASVSGYVLDWATRADGRDGRANLQELR